MNKLAYFSPGTTVKSKREHIAMLEANIRMKEKQIKDLEGSIKRAKAELATPNSRSTKDGE